MTRRLQTYNGVIDSTEALPLRKRSISTRPRSAPDGENEQNRDVMSSPQVTTGDRIIDDDRARGLLNAPAHRGSRLEEHGIDAGVAPARNICWRQRRAIAAVQPVSTTLRLWIGGDARFTRLRRRWTGW